MASSQEKQILYMQKNKGADQPGHLHSLISTFVFFSGKYIHYLCEDGIEKSVPQDHRLSSLDKPRDSKHNPRDGPSYSYPHIHHGSL